jgi:hypothetical protein
MKRRSIFNRLIISMLIPIVICGCSASARISSVELINIKSMVPPNGKGLVFILRPGSIAGSAITFKITCDDREIGTVGSKQFIYTILDPGTHKFVGKAENRSELFLSVQPNQVYYLTDQIEMGMWSAGNALTRIDLEDGMKMLQKNNLSANCPAYKVTK